MLNENEKLNICIETAARKDIVYKANEDEPISKPVTIAESVSAAEYLRILFHTVHLLTFTQSQFILILFMRRLISVF